MSDLLIQKTGASPVFSYFIPDFFLLFFTKTALSEEKAVSFSRKSDPGENADQCVKENIRPKPPWFIAI